MQLITNKHVGVNIQESIPKITKYLQFWNWMCWLGYWNDGKEKRSDNKQLPYFRITSHLINRIMDIHNIPHNLVIFKYLDIIQNNNVSKT